MDRHETKARIEAQMDEWKRNLDTMKAKAGASTGDANVAYRENLANLQKQYDELKVRAAATWDVAEDSWEDKRKDIELQWQEWKLNAKKAWAEHTK